MRAAIYTRYSTDLQSATSIEDQLRICRAFVDKQGWTVVGEFADRAISGATMHRPGIRSLLTACVNREVDVIVAEALDRFSRSQADIAGIFERLEYGGVAMWTIGEGQIGSMHIGLKGTMNAEFLRELSRKTKRGVEGRVLAGCSGGGNSYGYDVARDFDGRGEALRGLRRINPAQAEIVRRVMREYAAGVSPKKIALALNAEGVPAPRGGAWSGSTLNGNRERGTGILNNELYIGLLVWNRQSFRKNPDTGKRIPFPNPRDRWTVVEAPAFRIVDDQLWNAVRCRQEQVTRASAEASDPVPFWQKQRPRFLLSGKMVCGECGARYTKRGANRFACFGAIEKGPTVCTNRLSVGQHDIEARVLTALSENLMQPDMFELFVREYIAETNLIVGERGAARGGIEAELRGARAKIGRIKHSIMEGVDPTLFVAELKDLSARADTLEAELSADAAGGAEEPLLHPRLAAIYRAKVADLTSAFADEDLRAEAFDLIRSLIEEVVMTPRAGELHAEIKGELAGILTLCAGGKQRNAPAEVSAEAQYIKMVAGTGFEPVTFRL